MDTITICPEQAGYEVMLRFTLFDVEANGSVCVDNFYIFDGNTTNDEIIKAINGTDSWCWDQSERTPTGSGNLEDREIVSTHESGCLTIVFQSDAGFIIQLCIAQLVLSTFSFAQQELSLRSLQRFVPSAEQSLALRLAAKQCCWIVVTPSISITGAVV